MKTTFLLKKKIAGGHFHKYILGKPYALTDCLYFCYLRKAQRVLLISCLYAGLYIACKLFCWWYLFWHLFWHLFWYFQGIFTIFTEKAFCWSWPISLKAVSPTVSFGVNSQLFTYISESVYDSLKSFRLLSNPLHKKMVNANAGYIFLFLFLFLFFWLFDTGGIARHGERNVT